MAEREAFTLTTRILSLNGCLPFDACGIGIRGVAYKVSQIDRKRGRLSAMMVTLGDKLDF